MFMLAILILAFYLYFISRSVYASFNLNKAKEELRQERLAYQQAEEQYINKLSQVTINSAKEAGFVDAKDPIFVERRVSVARLPMP